MIFSQDRSVTRFVHTHVSPNRRLELEIPDEWKLEMRNKELECPSSCGKYHAHLVQD